MPVTNSARRGLKLLGGTSSDKKIDDLKAIRDAFIQLDIEIDRLRNNSLETVTHIHGGKANGGAYIRTSGAGIDSDPVIIVDPPVDGGGGGGGSDTWTVGQTNFAFTGAAYTPSANFAF